jgi:hypothetical protein
MGGDLMQGKKGNSYLNSLDLSIGYLPKWFQLFNLDL